MNTVCCQIWNKFQVQELELKTYEYWVWSLRPSQTTLGSSLLISKEHSERLGALSLEAFQELKKITSEIEAILQRKFHFQKLNYLALMMVDPHLHFHIVPRYDSPRQFHGASFLDEDWPKAPSLKAVSLEIEALRNIKNHLITPS